MAKNSSALVRDPILLAEDEEICDRIRADLLQCIDDCQSAAQRARDRGFKRALNCVSECCRAGIQALEKHLVRGTGMEPEATPDAASPSIAKQAAATRVIHGEKKDESDWRPGGDGHPSID